MPIPIIITETREWAGMSCLQVGAKVKRPAFSLLFHRIPLISSIVCFVSVFLSFFLACLLACFLSFFLSFFLSCFLSISLSFFLSFFLAFFLFRFLSISLSFLLFLTSWSGKFIAISVNRVYVMSQLLDFLTGSIYGCCHDFIFFYVLVSIYRHCPFFSSFFPSRP